MFYDARGGESMVGIQSESLMQELEPHALLESLVRAMPDSVTATDLAGRIIIASRRSAELHGAESEEDLLGMSAFDFIAHEDRDRAAASMQATLEHGSLGPVEFTMLRKDGSRFCGELNVSVVPGGDGSPQGFVAAVRDISERKRSERALRESEERYRNLVELLPDPVVVLQDGRYRFVNSAFTEVFGYAQDDVDAGLSFFDLVSEAEKEAVRERYEQRLAGVEVPKTYRVDLVAKDGRVVPCETSASLIQHEGCRADLVIIRDVSEREEALERERKLQASIQQAQKMESLGLLAGGVAHDFNNLLVGVLAHAGLARRALPRNSAVRSNIDMIETSAHRAAELCDQLLAYSGSEQPDLAEVNLSSLAAEMFELLHIPLSRKARLVLDLAPELPLIAGDPTQLRQMFMNLIQNAADATSTPAGEVVVRTGVEDCDAELLEELELHGEISPGPHVFVEVRDNGAGMAVQNTRKVFEPFFTTKRSGRGLGLAVVRGIVNTHRGAIEVKSATGKGTVFRVLFPAREARRASVDQSATPALGHAATVLVVDDDAMVRTVVEDVLADSGLNVLSAADGEEALEIFAQHTGEISAVLVDLNMPGMRGEELLARLRELVPDLRVVLSSGFWNERVGRVVSSDPQVTFVAKPFDLEQLLHAMKGASG